MRAFQMILTNFITFLVPKILRNLVFMQFPYLQIIGEISKIEKSTRSDLTFTVDALLERINILVWDISCIRHRMLLLTEKYIFDGNEAASRCSIMQDFIVVVLDIMVYINYTVALTFTRNVLRS